jgi:uncharacterized protein (DUF488 family)
MLTMTKPVIYTIGHSTHVIEYFIELLKHHGVNCVVDVRSLPASRFNPQYNKKALADALTQQGITYLHFGEEFGARQTDPSLLDEEGRVDFEKIRDSEKITKGIERLTKGIHEGYTIALMCSEAEPLHCHRFSMISVALKDFDVRHILKDKSIRTQEQLENDLLKMYSNKLSAPDMFHNQRSDQDRLRLAYKLLNKSVAYSPASHKSGFRKK